MYFLKTMKQVKKWKRILLFFIALLFIVRIGFIAIRGEVDKKYYTSTVYDLSDYTTVPIDNLAQTFSTDEQYLNSLELYLVNIADDKMGSIMLSINRGDTLVYQTNISLKNINNNEWKRVVINSKMQVGTEYQIVLDASEECSHIPDMLVVNNSFASEIINSYSEKNLLNGNISINYGYLQFPDYMDRLVMISLWLLLYLLITFVIIKIEVIAGAVHRIKEKIENEYNPEIILLVFEILGAMLIFYCSKIEFEGLTKILFYAVSIIAVSGNHQKISFVNKAFNKKWKKVIFYILCFYAAFALVGQRVFIYPLTMKVTTEGIFVYICTALWFIPVLRSLMYYLQYASVHFVEQNGGGTKEKK